MTNTILNTIKKKMLDLQTEKAAELEKIQRELAEARGQKEAADLAVKEATEHLNLDAFEKAQKEAEKAARAIEMYSARYKQIKAKEFITEAESNQAIDELLSYEEQLEKDFTEAVAGPLKEINKIVHAYMDEVNDTELTLTRWQREIHANYSTRGRSSYMDPVTGERTDRSTDPVLVHQRPFLGCAAALYLRQYLDPYMDKYME